MFVCSVPEEFKNVSTRLKKLRWKDVKIPYICSLHFEANLFKGKSQYRINFSQAIQDLKNSPLPQAGPSALQPGPAAPQAGPSAPRAGPSALQPGPAAPQAGPSAPRAAPSALQPGPSAPQAGPSALQSDPAAPQNAQNNNTTTNNNNNCLNGNDALAKALQQIESLKKANEQIQKKYELAMTKNFKQRLQKNYLKRKQINMESSMTEMLKTIKSLEKKFSLHRTDIDRLQNCVSEVPKELFSATAKRAEGGRVRAYHPALRKFAMTLHLCSPKAYR